MLQIIISSSLLILVLLGLRLLLRGRISLRFQYALWLLVAIRLLIPVTFGQSALSIENFTASTPTAQHSAPQAGQTSELLPSLDGVQRSQMPQLGGDSILVQSGSVQSGASGSQSLSPSEGKDAPVKTASFSWETVLTLIWVGGTVLLGLCILGSNLRFTRRLKKHSKVAPVEGCSLPVYETEEVVSPCLVGFLRPQIYLRPELTPEMRDHVLAHEYTHYRHGDHLWTLIRTLCLCVYWFHPLVWVAAYISRQDGELACDEGAIGRLGETQRIPYGKTLLQVIVHANYRTNFLNTATTMGANKAQLKERMTMIAKRPKKLLLTLLLTLLVVSLAVGCSFTGGREEPEDSPSQQETKESETTEDITTVPTEDEKIQPTHGEDVGIYVEDYLNEGSIRIPQIMPDSKIYSNENREILDLFENNSVYQSVDYSISLSTWIDTVWEEEREVLSLLITAEQTDGEIVYWSCNLDRETGYSVNLPDLDAKRKTELFARDLLERYETTGSLSYTASTHEILLQNLNHVTEPGDLSRSTALWVNEEGVLMCSFLYYPLDGSEPYRFTTSSDELLEGATGIEEPQVVELYTYTEESAPEEVNHLPFLLMNGPRAVEINGEILRTYSYNLRDLTYSWSLHGQLLSLAVTAKGLYTEGTGSNAYVLSTQTLTDAPRAEVLAFANMTEEEYNRIAGTMFEDQFFHLFPEADPNRLVGRDVIAMSGSGENVAESIPYLAEDGSLWALARIYQIAGSSYTWHLIPVSDHQFTEAYQTYAQ